MGEHVDPDLDLLEAWRRGARQAGRLLYGAHMNAVLRFFRRKVAAADVEDLAQQTWIVVVRSEPARVRTTLRAYLRGVARNVLYNHYRRIPQGGAFDPEVDTLVALVPSVTQQLASRQDVQRIEQKVQRLPVDLQLLFEAHFVDGLTGPELVEAFALPEGTVRSRLARVRRILCLEGPDAPLHVGTR